MMRYGKIDRAQTHGSCTNSCKCIPRSGASRALTTSSSSPSAEIETRTTWEARASSGKVYRISTAILADRAAGQSGPSSGWKPWGDALRLPVSPDWLTNLRDRILEGYQGPVSLKKPELPVITYLARQNAGRRLHPPDHEALWTALQGIEAAGLAEVNMEDFNSTIPFETQVATIARTNVSAGTPARAALTRRAHPRSWSPYMAMVLRTRSGCRRAGAMPSSNFSQLSAPLWVVQLR